MKALADMEYSGRGVTVALLDVSNGSLETRVINRSERRS